MNRITNFLKAQPLFLFLLPFFFVLHGYVRNYNAVPAGDAFLLTLLYSASACIIALFSWLLFRNKIKSGIFAFILVAYHLFFGNMQDALKNVSASGLISQYRFILPASILIFIGVAAWLKKRKQPLLKVNAYLNVLLLALIVIDTGWLVSKLYGTEKYITINKTMEGHKIPGSCSKPDIYLLLMDQYAGSTALKDLFHFDNSPFLTDLSNRGFHTARHSISNYNLTPFSMASLLSMSYLPPEVALKTKLNVSYCYQVIRNSSTIKFLTENGYRFYNYSLFDFPNQPAHEYKAFLPYGIKLITLNSFTGRLMRDIRSAVIEGKFHAGKARREIAYEHLHFNDSIFNFTRNVSKEKRVAPKFVYAHFMLPHFPYYYDSKGNPSSFEKLTSFKENNSDDYIEYLQYGNKKIVQLIDDILTNSQSPPIIILLSDHGARNPNKKKDYNNDFLNLNAVYLPDKNYSLFYDSISNVNQFRVLFNTSFNQNLPLLKDSVSDIRN